MITAIFVLFPLSVAYIIFTSYETNRSRHPGQEERIWRQQQMQRQQQEMMRQQQMQRYQEMMRQQQMHQLPQFEVLKREVDEILEGMDLGAIAFNTPESINIEDSAQIQLILSFKESMEELKNEIAEEGKKEGAQIIATERMEARLSGDKFQILAITPELQAVSATEKTEWKWEIHPKEKGQHKLHLTLTALVKIDGQSTPRAIKTYSKIIHVNVTAVQKVGIFFQNNWQWLWATLLVPVGWVWKRRKNQLTNTSS